MIAIEELPAELGAAGHCEQKSGVLWMTPPEPDIRGAAALLSGKGARLVTIAAMELPEDGGIRLDYHWSLGGRLIAMVAYARGGRAPSIADICRGADWVEREIHEYYAVEFEGRVCDPLVLRRGDGLGLFLRKEDE